uniref:Uncharacterized protein n=1 Tax=Mustela putorius furo TaxID=9669 RepID=M3YMR2_MUSPF
WPSSLPGLKNISPEEYSWRDDERIKSERVNRNQARVDDGFKDPCILRIPGNTTEEIIFHDMQGCLGEWLASRKFDHILFLSFTPTSSDLTWDL